MRLKVSPTFLSQILGPARLVMPIDNLLRVTTGNHKAIEATTNRAESFSPVATAINKIGTTTTGRNGIRTAIDAITDLAIIAMAQMVGLHRTTGISATQTRNGSRSRP